jgi:hypothetical protein
MEDNLEFQKLLEEASKKSDDSNYFGKQTFNPMWGRLSIQDDKWTIIYNPFYKMRVNKKLLRIDEFVTSIFFMLKNKYEKNPKTIDVDLDIVLDRIRFVNPKCDAEYVLKNIFKDGDEVKFKVFTKDKKHYARLMLENKEKLIKLNQF